MATGLVWLVASAHAQTAQGGQANGVAATPAVAAATTPAAPTLRQALDSAWHRQGQERAWAARREELSARERATQSWLPAPPAATLAYRSDQLNANGGLREYEAELDLPLWNASVRGATRRAVAAERRALEQQLAQARLMLAGQVRDAAAAVALARAEHELAQRRLAEARLLADDLDRRVKAGDVARVDALQAQAAVRQAQTGLTAAQASLDRSREQWRSLTGHEHGAMLDEALPVGPAAGGSVAADAPLPDEHPVVQTARAQSDAAAGRLALAEADRRDPMELALGVTRERAAFGAPGEVTTRIALRIPLGGESRNAPRLAAARAELASAQTEADTVQRTAQSELRQATLALDAARRQLAQTIERVRFLTEVQTLVSRAHRLGESDLPTRLRADAELHEARLAQARADIETRHAVSRLNQSMGLLP